MPVSHAHGDSEKILSQNFTNTLAWCKKKTALFQRSQAALIRFLSRVNPGVSSQGCSVCSAHGAQRKVTVGYPQVPVKRCQRVSRNSQISKYPLLCPNVPLILVDARFEIQHDAVVNHVCMSRQLCQAESECPLLVRQRPMSLSGSAS